MASLVAKLVIGALGAAVVTTTAVQVMAGPVEATAGGSVEASVVKVVDGDTLDVRYGDDIHRVRLLNVDAPESKDPSRPVECLGRAASEFLADQLPVGSDITLEFDVELIDPYDRELAGVLKDDVLVNAEIARAGLGVPAYFAPNKRFLPQVESAHAEARANAVGLYDPAAECSISAHLALLKEAEQQIEESAPAQDATAGEIAAYLEEVEQHRGTAAALLLLLGGDQSLVPLAGYTPQELASMTSTARTFDTTWRAVQTTWESEHGQAVEREAAEARRQAEEDQRKAEEKAQREAEEAAEREAEAAEERRQAEEAARQEVEQRRHAEEDARRQAPAPSPAPAPAPSPAPPPAPAPTPAPAPAPEPPPVRPGAGYTGCRDYSKPGPYYDDKGRGYMPIDCKTKAPLLP